MKRFISLTLALAVFMGLGAAVAVSAAEGDSSVIYPELGGIVGDVAGESPFGKEVWLDATAGAVYVISGPESGYLSLTVGGVTAEYGFWDAATKEVVPFTYSGDGTRESISITSTYVTSEGTKTGIPTGVNGDELLNVRIAWDSADKVYKVYITPVANPTVELFTDVKLSVLVIVAGIKVYPLTTTAAEITAGTAKAQTLTFKGSAEIATFTLGNRRYTAKDAWKDASGNWRVSAADKRPIVESGVFTRAYGKKLTVDYPQYRVIFPTVKNQDVALNLAANVSSKSTIALDGKEPILVATFHDIYVKDKVQIEFKIAADAQNYKGTTLYAYELDSKLKPIKAKEVKVTVSDSSTIVVEIAANTRLASTGVKYGTFGIYGSPQEATSTGDDDDDQTSTGGGKDKNPASGPMDSVNIATAFAVISLAAAGFVAVGKAGKR